MKIEQILAKDAHNSWIKHLKKEVKNNLKVAGTLAIIFEEIRKGVSSGKRYCSFDYTINGFSNVEDLDFQTVIHYLEQICGYNVFHNSKKGNGNIDVSWRNPLH